MKLNILLRNSLIFTLFLLTINLFSCKTDHDIPREYTNSILKNQSDNKTYFIKLDSISGSFAKGRMYFIYKDLTMRPKTFILNIKKNKCVVEFSNSNIYTLKLKRKNKGKYEGSIISNIFSGKKHFILYPYTSSGSQVLNINRYKEELFDVERITNIKYAKVKGFWSSIPDDTIDVGNVIKIGFLKSLKRTDLDLDMDIYIPKNDTLSKRPLMMFIHGGAFFIGDKATLPYQKWCTHFASLGYVCVSINYRMGFRINSKAIERTAYQATQDAHAAMRYLLSKKDIYRINPDLLFVGGASAGSITAINLAYMRNKDRPQSSYSSFFMEDLGDIESSGNDIDNNFKINAIANMWGSVYDLNIMKNANVPIISFHGDVDEILPYGKGYPFRAIGEFQKYFFDEMYGSSCIHEKAQELGIRSELHTFHGQGHALHLDENRNLNDNFYTIQNEITDFFYDELIPYPVCIIQDNNDVQIFTIDTTDVAAYDWEITGGISIEESRGKIRASWFDDEECQMLRISGQYKNGAGFNDILILKDIREK